MPYYSAELVFHSQIYASPDEHKEVMIYTLAATDSDHALAQAVELGAKLESDNQETQQRQFIEVENIRQLDADLHNCQIAVRKEALNNLPDQPPKNQAHAVQALIYRNGALHEQRLLLDDDDLEYCCEMYDDSRKSFSFAEQYQRLLDEEYSKGNQENYQLYASYFKWGETQEDRRQFMVCLAKQPG